MCSGSRTGQTIIWMTCVFMVVEEDLEFASRILPCAPLPRCSGFNSPLGC